MAIVNLPPAPIKEKEFTSAWHTWLLEVKRKLANTIQVHNDLASIQGGINNQYYHLTATQASEITNGYSGIITTAKLTPGGAEGSMTFSHGILTSQTAAT